MTESGCQSWDLPAPPTLTYGVIADSSDAVFGAFPPIGTPWSSLPIKATRYTARTAPRTFWQWLTGKPGNQWIVDVEFETVETHQATPEIASPARRSVPSGRTSFDSSDRPPNVLEQTKAFAKREQR